MTRREKYTIKTIKQTAVYQANIEAVKAIYPGHEEDFARELMVAANEPTSFFHSKRPDLRSAIHWRGTKQGILSWSKLTANIHMYKKRKAAA